MNLINFKAKMEQRKKPLVVYFHRYSIEYESVQFPVARKLIDLILKKHEVLYFSMKTSEHVEEKLRKGIKIKEIPLKVNNKSGVDKWFKTFLYYILLPKTLFELKKQNPDFIICKETMPFIPYFIKFFKIPMLIDTSDWWWSILFGKNKYGRKLAGSIERFEVKKWDKPYVTVIAHTKAEADLIAKKGFPIERIKIINAPLYEGVYFPCNAEKQRKLLSLKKSDFVVAVHGIIHPSKGYGQLLEWWKKLISAHKNWKLVIIGGSIGESWCRNKIKERNLSENVIMTGWLPTQQDVNLYLNAVDSLLVIRRNSPENIGIVPSALYHSLMLSKPVLATGLPGISEIITDKENGFLYKPDSFESFKSSLEFINKNKKKSLEIAKKGVKRAKECFNPDKAIKKYLEVIERGIIEKKREK